VAQQTIAIAIFAAGFNIFLAKRLPMFEGIILFAHLLAFFCVLIPLWVLAPKVPLSEVFGAAGFADYGGWGSIGAACIVGQLAASSAFVGVDGAAHMAEEVCTRVGRYRMPGMSSADSLPGKERLSYRATHDDFHNHH
jgi:choline transport protein